MITANKRSTDFKKISKVPLIVDITATKTLKFIATKTLNSINQFLA